MSEIDLSIIIPARNNKAKNASIIKMVADETRTLNVEFIVIDLNSTDGGVLDALNMIKTGNLKGCVIQCGNGTVSAALNTGINKAKGKYITFVYPTRLYKNYINNYFKAAEEKNAEFVFAVPSSADGGQKELIPDGIKGTDIVVRLIRSSIYMDFTAVLYRRDFLIRNNIRFYEECTLGYAEAFIYNSLLANPVTACIDMEIKRDYVNSLIKGSNAGVSNNCFERLEAMIKVSENCRLLHKNDTVLNDAFEYQKLPAVVINCIDRLMDEGFSKTSIRKLLKNKGYEDYMKISINTSDDLKKKVVEWKFMPWLYR